MCPFPTGESRAIAYQKLNVKMERVCKWFSSAFLASNFVTALLPLLYTGVAYNILDLGLESYLLYPPTEFVLFEFI